MKVEYAAVAMPDGKNLIIGTVEEIAKADTVELYERIYQARAVDKYDEIVSCRKHVLH